MNIVGVQLHYLDTAGVKRAVETPNLVGVHPERIAKMGRIGSVVSMALTAGTMQSPVEDVEDKVAAMRSGAAVRVVQIPRSETQGVRGMVTFEECYLSNLFALWSRSSNELLARNWL